MWDLRTRSVLFERPSRQCCLANFTFSPSGMEVVVAGIEPNDTSIVLDAESGRELAHWKGTIDGPMLIFDPRARYVVGVEQRNPPGERGRTLIWRDNWSPPRREARDVAQSPLNLIQGSREKTGGTISNAMGDSTFAGSTRLGGGLPVQSTAQNFSLELFGVEIKTATRAELNRAIVRAGGLPTPSARRGSDMYDATKVGLLGATSLELVFDGDHFVLATYELSPSKITSSDNRDERLRKMLVSKYGAPFLAKEQYVVNEREPLTAIDPHFTDQHGGRGRRIWLFERGMFLIYRRGFFGDRSLTYVDMDRFDAVMTRAEKASDDAARKEAAEKSSVF